MFRRTPSPFLLSAAILVGFLSFSRSVTFAEVMDQEASVMSVGDQRSHNFSMSFFSISTLSNMKPGKIPPANISDRLVDTYDYFSLNYRIDAESKASLQIPLLMSTEGINEYGDAKPAKVSLSDIHFVYSNYDLGYIGDMDLSGNVKLFLPTSAYSQAAKTIAKLRFEGFMTWKYARFSSLQYVCKPDIYFQSQTAYFNAEDIPQFEDGTFMRDPRSTNKQFALEHFIELNFDLNKYFTVLTKMGFNEDWYYASQAEQLDGGHVTKYRAGLGLFINAFKKANFTLGVQNDTVLGSNHGNDIAFFQPENTQYSLMSNVFIF